MFLHIKCRNSLYPLSKLFRTDVADGLVDWSVPFPSYDPPQYESTALRNKPWADPSLDNRSFAAKWNQLDGTVNRESHIPGGYEIVNGAPRNPFGRTGLRGRGLLGRWGPNHAADPMLTRWQRDSNDQCTTHSQSQRHILQLCAIQRQDNGEWAIPGGMVDPGERVSVTLKREFMEEALHGTERLSEDMARLFESGEEIYRGYVDDPRNTDNSWMETVAVNFHDGSGKILERVKLNAGSDAAGVKWIDLNGNLNLYASHKQIIRKVVDKLGAHW